MFFAWPQDTMVRLVLLLVSVLTVHASLRGTPDSPEAMSCIAPHGSCDPVKDRCCQGPGLMTCRLRPTLAKGDEGTAYVCGEEFPHELVNSKCAAEGQECRTDDHCCQIDPTLQVSCQKVRAAPGKTSRVCKAKLSNTGEAMALCISEGGSCNPLENSCCQEGPQGANLSCAHTNGQGSNHKVTESLRGFAIMHTVCIYIHTYTYT